MSRTDQTKMDAWRERPPFHSIGIHISGTSCGCRSQPNLTPPWISTQLAKGRRQAAHPALEIKVDGIYDGAITTAERAAAGEGALAPRP